LRSPHKLIYFDDKTLIGDEKFKERANKYKMRLYLVQNMLEENGSNQKQRAVPIQDQSILSFDDFERLKI